MAEGFFYVAKITLMLVFLCLTCDECDLTTCFMYLIRRNTSVDESYEWDSADACVDTEVLEAMRLDQSQMGFRRGRHDQASGLQGQRRKGELSFICLFLLLHVSV